MTKRKNWLMPVLLGAVLMATLVGVAVARPNDRAPEAITRKITVPAGAFHPRHDGLDFDLPLDNVELDAGSGGFAAQVVFPTGRGVIVEKLSLYAYDNNSTGTGETGVCARLRLQDVTAATGTTIAEACSTGASTTDPRVFTDTSISPDEVKHGKGIQARLYFDDHADLRVYGLRIEYHNK